MRFSRIALLAILGAIFISLIAFRAVKPSVPASPGVTSGWKTFRSDHYGFTLRYPGDAEFFSGEDSVYTVGEFFQGAGISVAGIALPGNSYPGTNFLRAFLAIAVSPGTSSVAECRMFKRDGDAASSLLEGRTTINGIEFFNGEVRGAAAGTLLTSRIYHSFQRGRCYEMSLNFFTGNIANYEVGTIHEVNAALVWDRLQQVLETFSINR